MRTVRYETLIKTGRAVRSWQKMLPNGETVYWVEMRLAGEQSDKAEENSVRIGFSVKHHARKAHNNLWMVLRQLEHEGQINTDARYNQVAREWAQAAHKKLLESQGGANGPARYVPGMGQGQVGNLSGMGHGDEDGSGVQLGLGRGLAEEAETAGDETGETGESGNEG